MPTSSRAASPLPLLAVVAGALLVGAAVVAGAWWALDDGPPEATTHVGAAATAPEADGWAPWDRNADGTPVRWDPCSPIELVVAPEGAYPGFERDLAEAIDDVEEASGLTLDVVGEVAERPAVDRSLHQAERYGDRWAPVLVAFAEPGEGGLPMIDTDRALAIPVAVGRQGARGYVSGQVVLNVARDDLSDSPRDRAGSWGATLRHELGHLLGLAHVDDEDELMHRFPGRGPVELGEGDRRGLRALGSGDCVETPAPQPLEVEVERPS